MMKIDIAVETLLDHSPRVKQLSGMFDVPLRQKLTQCWAGKIPLDERDNWNIGLIVGPSGAGKSTMAQYLFGEPRFLRWKARAVVDDFDPKHSIEDISAACSAVGFNTIPAWCKPYKVLSTGERFRVELARHLLEDADPVVIDEFSSVVDRQVAKIGSHAAQKMVRKRNRKFVAITCHYDVIDWLQPDWMLEPATMTFQWRAVQRRPTLDVEIARVDYAAWRLFAPFHYLTAELHPAATCFCLFVEGVPASFIAMLYRPHPKRRDLWGISRAVTLPDYQGLGLVMALESVVCGAYRALGYSVHGYPAHPPHIRSLDRSPEWRLIKKPGKFSSPSAGYTHDGTPFAFGGRPCAVFEFVGKPIDTKVARKLLGK